MSYPVNTFVVANMFGLGEDHRLLPADKKRAIGLVVDSQGDGNRVFLLVVPDGFESLKGTEIAVPDCDMWSIGTFVPPANFLIPCPNLIELAMEQLQILLPAAVINMVQQICEYRQEVIGLQETIRRLS